MKQQQQQQGQSVTLAESGLTLRQRLAELPYAVMPDDAVHIIAAFTQASSALFYAYPDGLDVGYVVIDLRDGQQVRP